MLKNDINRRVNSLSVNPINDNFLSGGDDGTVLMWDIRAQNARVSASTRSSFARY